MTRRPTLPQGISPWIYCISIYIGEKGPGRDPKQTLMTTQNRACAVTIARPRSCNSEHTRWIESIQTMNKPPNLLHSIIKRCIRKTCHHHPCQISRRTVAVMRAGWRGYLDWHGLVGWNAIKMECNIKETFFRRINYCPWPHAHTIQLLCKKGRYERRYVGNPNA